MKFRKNIEYIQIFHNQEKLMLLDIKIFNKYKQDQENLLNHKNLKIVTFKMLMYLIYIIYNKIVKIYNKCNKIIIIIIDLYIFFYFSYLLLL